MLSGQETKDDVISVDRLNNPSKQNRNYNNAKCHRCGSVGHKPGECRAISMKCNNCQKIGHLARVCLSKTVPRKPYGSQNISNKKKGRRHKKVCAIRHKDTEASQESYSESESGEEYVLFMEGHDNRTQVTINDQKIKMVADTGCRQNIISSQLYKEQFRRFPLERTTKQFVAYGQKIPLTCLGRFKAKLKAGMTAINSYVYVIEGEAESLLGRKSCFDL